jgi:hypothetical protein
VLYTTEMAKNKVDMPTPPSDLAHAIHLSGVLDMPGIDVAPSADGSSFVLTDELGEIYATLEDLEAGWLAVARAKN